MKKPKIQALIGEIRLMPPAEDAASIGLELANRVEEVLKLHKRVPERFQSGKEAGGPDICEHCTSLRPSHLLELYPCPTIRALEGSDEAASGVVLAWL